MAKILTYFHLCPINDEEEFLGLSHDETKGNIINTLGKNIIINVKLSNQKQINSWTGLEKLSSKVVHDSISKQYVGPFAHKWIRCWDKNCTDINAVKKIRLSKPIHDLISTTQNGTIVLYTDGTCESLEYAIETRKERKDLSLPPFKAIVDQSSFELLKPFYIRSMDGNILLTYFIKSRTDDEMHLIYFKLDSDSLRLDGNVGKVKLIREEKGMKLCGFTVVDSATYPQLVTIWADRKIFMMPIRLNTESIEYAPGYFVSVLNALNVDQPLSVLGISRDCIAIYGANATPQEGAALILYNTQFKVIESKQLFKVYFNKSRLWAVDTYVFLAVGQKLAVVSFRTSNEQLSDMLGSQRTTNLTSFVDTECINGDAELEEVLEFNKIMQIHANNAFDDDTNSYNELDTIVDYNIEKGKKTFENVDNIMSDIRPIQYHNISVEFNQDNELLTDMIQLKLLSNMNSAQFENKTIQMIVAELERLGECEIAISNLIIPICIESDSPDDLINCIRIYANISEKMIALSLKYFIDKIRNEKNDTNDTNESISIYTQYRTIMSCNFEPDSMTDQLRLYLNFDDILHLLNFITNALQSNDTQLELRLNDNHQFDEDLHLIEWFSVLIDSHFHQFFLSRNVQLVNKLEKWKILIDNLLSDLQQSKTLSAMLYDLVNGKLIAKENIASKWYSVEEVQLY